MGWKVYYAVLMWRFHRRKILPSGWVNRVPICECHSPLVDISKSKVFFSMSESAKKRGGCWVREEVADFLRAAEMFLPKGYKLHFFGGWRHFVVQMTNWESNLADKRKEFPNASESEVKRISRMTSADPTRGGFGPHQTGGAIDLTIVDRHGKELDMGTKFSFHGPESATDFPGITSKQRANRNMLRDAMTRAGFQNYPGEWWHYSYGDRAYAAYQRLPCAIYGEVYCHDYKLTKEEKKLWENKK